MKKSVSVIELDYHPEVLKYLIEIISELEEFTFKIFTTEKLLAKAGVNKQLIPVHIKFFLKKESETKSYFVQKNLIFINESDLVYFNTLVSDAEIYLKNQIEPVKCLRIHNSNSYLTGNLSYKISWDPLILFKDLSYFFRKMLLKKEVKNRNEFIKQFQYFVFPSQNTLRFALENYTEFASRIWKWSLPIIYNDTDNKITNNSSTSVLTIPGTVDRRRRNYQVVIEALKLLRNEKHPDLEIHLLGKPSGFQGKKIQRKLKQFSSDRIKVVTYDGFVPEAQFEETMKKTDFILIPLNVRTRFTVFEEIYGYTKISGNVNDAIRYGKKGIINADYKVDKEISSSFLYFNDAHSLKDILSRVEEYKSLIPEYSFYEKQKIVSSYRLAFSTMCSREDQTFSAILPV